MKRKINRVGVNTLTVSLPSEWVTKHHLNAGDELVVYPEHDRIAFSINEQKSQNKEITLVINDMSRQTVSKYLTTLYIHNFSKIVLTYESNEIYDNKNEKNISIKNTIRVLSHRFIGMEIVSQTNKKTELSCFILNQDQNLEVIEKRIYHLLHETINELLEAIDNDYNSFHATIYDHHDNIIKFMYYYLRMVDISDNSEDQKKVLFTFYMKLDYIIDKIRHLSEKIQEYGCTEKVKKILKEIFDFYFQGFIIMYKGIISEEWITKRYQLVKKIKKTALTLEEYNVISEIKILLDTMNNFHEVIMVRKAEQLLTNH
ncbi:AbrB/MazE/SpoVT family DNA-binding domain-containing protein [Candidatus Woesearchaeota archaeon]|nr:AbrB/MazE/SpoVT family DNA-binding domain-containing protein [Candidatus Woesearchaeota archaeon]